MARSLYFRYDYNTNIKQIAKSLCIKQKKIEIYNYAKINYTNRSLKFEICIQTIWN